MAKDNSAVQIDIDLAVVSKNVEKSVMKVSDAIQQCVTSATDLTSAINQTPERFYGVSRKIHSSLAFVKEGLTGLGTSFETSLQDIVKSSPYYAKLQSSIKSAEVNVSKLSARYNELNEIASSGYKPVTDAIDKAAIKQLQDEIRGLTEKTEKYTSARESSIKSIQREKSYITSINTALQHEQENREKLSRALKANAIGKRAYNKAIFESDEKTASLQKMLKSTSGNLKSANARYQAYGINISKANAKIDEHNQTIQNILESYRLTDSESKKLEADLDRIAAAISKYRGAIQSAKSMSSTDLLSDMFNNMSTDDKIQYFRKVTDVIEEATERVHGFESILGRTNEIMHPTPEMGANAAKFAKTTDTLLDKYKNLIYAQQTLDEFPELKTPQVSKKMSKDIDDLIFKLDVLRRSFVDIDSSEYSAHTDTMEEKYKTIEHLIVELNFLKDAQRAEAEEEERLAQRNDWVSTTAQRLSSTWNMFRRVVSGTAKTLKTTVKVYGTVAKAVVTLLGKVRQLIKSFTKLNKHSSSNGITLKKLFRGLLQFGIGVRTLYYLVRKIRTEFVSGFQELGNVVPSVNDQIVSFTSALNTLKGSFVTAFQPVVSVVIPILNTLMTALSNVMFTLAQFFATLTGQKVVYKAVANSAGAAADAVGGVGDAAGDAADEMKDLAEYDNLLVIDDDEDSGSGSGSGGGSGASSDTGYSFVEVDSATSKFAEMVKNAWKAADFTEVGNYIGEALQKALQSIDWDKIQQTAHRIGSSLATLINGFVEEELNGISLGTTIGTTFGEAINTGIELLKGFNNRIHWDSISTFINEGVSSFLTSADFAGAGTQISSFLGGALTAALDVTGNSQNWTAFKKKFVQFMQNLNIGSLISKNISIASNIIVGLADSLYSYIESGQAYKDFSAVTSGIVNAIGKFKNSDIVTGAEKIGRFISLVAQNLIYSFSQIVTNLGEIATKIIEGIANALTGDSGNGDGTTLGDALIQTIINAAIALCTSLGDAIDALALLAMTIINTIIDNLPEIAEGLKECIKSGGWKVVAAVGGMNAIKFIGSAILRAIAMKLTATLFANVLAFGVAVVAAAVGVMTKAGLTKAEESDPDVHKSDADVGRDRNVTAQQDDFWGTYASDITYATSTLQLFSTTLAAVNKGVEDADTKTAQYKSTVIDFAEKCGYSYNQFANTLTATVKSADGSTKQITFNLDNLNESTVSAFRAMQTAASAAGVTIPANIALGLITGQITVKQAADELGIEVPEGVSEGVANKKSRKKVDKAIDDLADSVKEDEYDDKFTTAGENGASALASAIESGDTEIGEASDTLKSSIIGKISPVEGDMTTTGTNSGKNLYTSLGKNNQNVRLAAAAIYKIVVKAFDNLSTKMYEYGSTAGKKLSKGLKAQAKNLEKVTETINDSLQFPNYEQYNYSTGYAAVLGLTRGIEGIQPSLIKVVNLIKDRLKMPNYKQYNYSMGYAASLGVKNGMNALVNNIKALYNSITGYMWLPNYYSHNYNMGFATANGIYWGMESCKAKISRMYNTFTDYMWLPDYYSHSYDMGYYIGQGIYNGLNAWKTSIKDMMTYICNNLTKTARVTLKISSPSKVMRKLFGYAGEGMYLGLVDYEDIIAEEMDVITSHLTNNSVLSGTKLPANKAFRTSFDSNNSDNTASIENLIKNIQDLIANQTAAQLPEKIQVTLPNGRVLAETVWSEQKKYYKQTGFTTPRFT